MTDPALFRVGAIGAILAAICCSAPLLIVGLPPASLDAWLAGAVGCCFPATRGLRSRLRRRRARATACEMPIHKEGVKP